MDTVIEDKELYELSEMGFSDRKIAEYFKEKGIEVTASTIKKRIIKIYEEKRNQIPKNEISDEEVYKLREQGFTYTQIANYFKDKGISTNVTTIANICKRIYEKKGKEDPKIRLTQKLNQYNEKIYMLREQRYTYNMIADYLNEKGISISPTTVRIKCKEIYAEKGKEVPRVLKYRMKSKPRTKPKLSIQYNEEIYKLRERRLSYQAIARCFKEEGISISKGTIRKICKEIYAEKGKEEPKGSELRREVSNEEIYRLRERRYTYNMIVDYFKEKGISISEGSISKICKEIYLEKGKEEPKGSETSREVSNEEIYELREQRLSYQEIAEHFNGKGISISIMTIARRCKEIYAVKGEKEPKAIRKNRTKEKTTKISNKQLAKAILNLAITRKATVDQIKTIAEYYQVDLEKVFEDAEEER